MGTKLVKGLAEMTIKDVENCDLAIKIRILHKLKFRSASLNIDFEPMHL
jgi:hypothetical protein